MNYKLRFPTNAFDDIQRHKKSGDKKILKKIEILLEELKEHPRTGIGQPEQLKNDLQGLYSRRINLKLRIVYKIQDEIVTVIILNAYSHYGDK